MQPINLPPPFRFRHAHLPALPSGTTYNRVCALSDSLALPAYQTPYRISSISRAEACTNDHTNAAQRSRRPLQPHCVQHDTPSLFATCTRGVYLTHTTRTPQSSVSLSPRYDSPRPSVPARVSRHGSQVASGVSEPYDTYGPSACRCNMMESGPARSPPHPPDSAVTGVQTDGLAARVYVYITGYGWSCV